MPEQPQKIEIKTPDTSTPRVDTGIEHIPDLNNESNGEKIITQEPLETPSIASSTTSPTTVVEKNEVQRLADIERILEEDLGDIYFKLAPADKEKFRVGGETAARQINTLLAEVSVQLKKVIDVIRNWLKLIPGVNAYFLEQEAKIKADRILKLNQPR